TSTKLANVLFHMQKRLKSGSGLVNISNRDRWEARGVKSVRTIQALCGALLLGATTFCSAATVNSVRVWSGPDSTRVVFELTAPVEHRVSTLADPARVVIDLPDTKAAGPLSLPEPKGVVAAVRAGSRSGGDLRVVLELTKAAKAKTFLLAPNEQYGNRLVVDLVRENEDSPVVNRTAAPPPTPISPPAPIATPPP